MRNYLEQELGIAEPARRAWCRHWIAQGRASPEAKLFDVNTGAYPNCERIRDIAQSSSSRL